MSLSMYTRLDSYAASFPEDGLVKMSDFDMSNLGHQTYIPSNSDCFLGKNYSDLRVLPSHSYQYNSLAFNTIDLENQHPHQNLWGSGATSGLTEYIYGEPKNSKIWRPFSPTPSQANLEMSEELPPTIEKKTSGKSSYNLHHTIMPSGVKIEPSQSSVFKPFKKKSYSCTHCNMTYLTSSQLMSHMRVHTGSKPYRCEICYKTFSRNEELTRHRRIHSGYKPHLCGVCGKRFGRKDHLAKHRKTHLQVSEKKVYLCCMPGCGHRYTRSDALTRHKSTAHAMHKPRK